MKKQSSKPIGELLREYLNSMGGMEGLLGARVVRCWDEKMEPNIVKATSSRFYKDGTLYVNLSSSIIRSTLFNRRRQILFLLNSNLGGPFVKNIVLR